MIVTGGQFQRTRIPMYFLAGNVNNIEAGAKHCKHFLLSVAFAKSEKSWDRLDPLFADGIALMFDSGIHTLVQEEVKRRGCSTSDALRLPPSEIKGALELIETYKRLLTRHGDASWGYVEFDQGGMEWKRRTRAEFEDQGFKPIPVYHPLIDPPEYLFELCETYDRVCVGNIAVGTERPNRTRIMYRSQEAKQRFPDCWIHGLGYTPDEFMIAFPFDSADSSNWLTGMQYPVGIGERACAKTVFRFGAEFKYRKGDKRSQAHAYEQAAYMSTLHELNMAHVIDSYVTQLTKGST